MPRNSMKTISATIAVLATVLLAGCSATTSANPDTSTDGASGTPAPVAQTEPESRRVTVVKVIDPTTIVVTPVEDSDTLYGTKFTVHLNDFSTAAKGECGYAETLALAKTTLTEIPWTLDYRTVTDDVWIDDQGDHHGYLTSTGPLYGDTMMYAGLAYLSDDAATRYLATPQREAQDAKTGLWGSCPGFGE